MRQEPKARHGKNKQKRSDCRQVAIGMAFDERGLPLAHEVFEGNMSDGKTLIPILDRLGADTGVTSGKDAPEKPLVILDAGFASKAYLADTVALRERIAKGLLKDAAKIQRAIGRLEKKHPRVARFFTLQHEPGGWVVTRDEAKFGQAGVFISVLAYHLLCWVREKLRGAGDVRDWKTLRRLLGTHCLATTRLPLEDGRVLHIRKATLPDAGQAQVYRKLGIDWKTEFTPQKHFVKS